MTKINVQKRELVETINGLFNVQEMPGKSFGLLVSKNIQIIKTALKEVEEIGKPSEEFMKLANRVQEIAQANPENGQDMVKELEKENKALVDERKVQLEKVDGMLTEEIEIHLEKIPHEVLPEDISGKQLTGIKLLINE
jgi:predicted transcriptional regulator